MQEPWVKEMLAEVAKDFDLADAVGRKGFMEEMLFRWSDETMRRLRRIADQLKVAHSPRTPHDTLIKSIVIEWTNRQVVPRPGLGDVVEVKPGTPLDWGDTRSTRTVVKGLRLDGSVTLERTIVREACARPDQVTVLPAASRPDP
jgi:hypothetical protein